MKKFNEWVSDRQDCTELGQGDLGMQTVEDDSLIENQLSQWVTRLAGLLQNLPEDKKQFFLGKIVTSIREIQ